MPTIIALSGRKNSGKNTLASYIKEWYHKNVGNDLIECSFADNLKDFCIRTLGLGVNQCYGSDNDKNGPTKYKWEDVPNHIRWKFGSDPNARKSVLSGLSTDELIEAYLLSSRVGLKTGFMSGREIMQVFGTDLIRQSFGNVWAQATIRGIRNQDVSAVITDNRFPNETLEVLSEPRGFVIRLTRSPFGKVDFHPSESSLDDFDWNRKNCFVIENDRMSVEEQNEAAKVILEQIFSQEQI